MPLVLIIILILFFILYKIKNNNNLNFTNKNIIDNKYYLTNFNNLDYKLRNCNINNCLNIYNNFIKPFTKEEIIIIKNLKKNMNNIINKLFSKNIFNYDFRKVKNNIENSLPHTRGNFIIYPQKLYDDFIKLNKNFIFSNKRYFDLMFHELFHIFQRNNPELINILYSDYWNLIKYEKKLPKKLKNIVRTNPDALPNNNWIFKIDNNYIMPLCIYNTNSNSISDTKTIYLELNNKIEFVDINKFYDLQELENYNKYFGIYNSNNYHPNELSSSIFEKIIYNNYYNINIEKSIGYNKMESFLRKYCHLY